MKLKLIGICVWVITCLVTVVSCSTGSDPEGIILEEFSNPAEECLRVLDIINDIAMDVNGIAMNNLNPKKQKITEDVASCLSATIHSSQENTILDSIVLDYGTALCTSNGANFKGKMTIIPTNTNLTEFEIRMKDFVSGDYNVTGNTTLSVIGAEGGKDFSFSMSDFKFVVIVDEESSTFTVSSASGNYKFIRDEENNTKDYIDDTFSFKIDMVGETRSGAAFTYTTTSDCVYSFLDKCDKIVGGKAIFSLTGMDGEGVFYFGGGDPVEDNDNNVSFSLGQVSKTFQL